MLPCLRNIPALLAASLLASCAHSPDVSVRYYLPRTTVSFKVVRTVLCDAANYPIIATNVTPAVAHAADRSRPFAIRLADLHGAFSDTDIRIEMYEDGRLKGVNATTSGQGEAIIKAASTLATAAFTESTKSPPTFVEECRIINGVSGGKGVSLIYEGVYDLDAAQAPDARPVPPDVSTALMQDRIGRAVGTVCAVADRVTAPTAPLINNASGKTDDVSLNLRQPGQVRFRVAAVHGQECATGGGTPDILWTGDLTVAQKGTDYVAPIPRAAMFGKETFAIALSDSGALTSVQYSDTNGAAAMANSITAALAATAGETTSQQVAGLKSESDLIAQQQRLVQCRANPVTCK